MCAKRAKSRLSRTHTFLGRFFLAAMAVATLKIHLLSWRTQSPDCQDFCPALCKVIDASMNCWHTWHLSLAAWLIFGLVIRGHFLGLSRWMSRLYSYIYGQIQLCWKVSVFPYIPHPNRRSAGKAAAGGLASAISANLRTIGNKSRHALHSLAGKCIRHSVFSIWHSIWLTVHRAATM